MTTPFASTPVLVIAFNRPLKLKRVIDALREVKPERVYLAVDGPRYQEERGLVDACIDAVGCIDWTRHVNLRANEFNFGCRDAVVSAIDWFFEHEESGAILEDDVLPGRGFLPFASAMLRRFELNPQVGFVTGFNRVPMERQKGADLYRFSRFAHVWGWATWRQVWQRYQKDITHWQRELDFKQLRQRVDGSITESLFWWRKFNQVTSGKLNTWDAQLQYLALREGLLTVAPRVSLTENIGFGVDATHTRYRPKGLQRASDVVLGDLPQYPVSADLLADRWEAREGFGASWTGLARYAWRAPLRYPRHDTAYPSGSRAEIAGSSRKLRNRRLRA